MVITRTPLRISFFGGGTDYPAWYQDKRGAVLSTTIDKYCYINCRRLPPFFGYKHRIVYSKYEQINKIDEIVHPAVREVFRFMRVKEGLEVHHDGDLPARSGLGSSSAFTVGLLYALYALQGKIVSKKRLALEAINIEQDMIKEHVGSQDQVIAAFGGFNKIDFSGRHNIDVLPVTIGPGRIKALQEHLMLFFTGITRLASDIAKHKIEQIPNKNKEFNGLCAMVDDALAVLNGKGPLDDFGQLLHETWKIKRTLSEKVSNPLIDNIYKKAMASGAIGGKLLGAGGGGFILFFVKPRNRQRLKNSLKGLLHVPFKFDNTGSQIIYYKESDH